MSASYTILNQDTAPERHRTPQFPVLPLASISWPLSPSSKSHLICELTALVLFIYFGLILDGGLCSRHRTGRHARRARRTRAGEWTSMTERNPC